MIRSQIITKVKARIDELSPFTGEELNPSISLIDSLLDEAAITVLKTFPLYALPVDNLPTVDHVAGYDASDVEREEVGYLPLPSDFLRLASFRMDGWKRTVYLPIVQGSLKYEQQSDDRLMGNISKPVVALATMGSPLTGGIGDQSDTLLVDANDYYLTSYTGRGLCLEYYSIPPGTTHSINQAKYIPIILPESCPDDLTDAISWVAAALVYQSTDQATAMAKAYEKVELLKSEYT